MLIRVVAGREGRLAERGPQTHRRELPHGEPWEGERRGLL